jgi:hypothetical protein
MVMQSTPWRPWIVSSQVLWRIIPSRTPRILRPTRRYPGYPGQSWRRGCWDLKLDDVGLGDEVAVLPCKHWFHDGCVVLWLKEHNTCPICRASIEGEQAGQSRRNEAASGSEAGRSWTPRSSARRHRPSLRQSQWDLLESLGDLLRIARGSSDKRSGSQWHNSIFSSIDLPLPRPSRARGPSPPSRSASGPPKGSIR